MSVSREILGVVRLSIGRHAVRPRDVLLLACGFAIASFTLVLLLAIPAGLERLGGQTGLDDIAIVFSASAQDESGSVLLPAVTALIGDLPGIAHAPDGQPLVAPQFLAEVKLRRPDGELASVLARGITPTSRQLVKHALRLRAGEESRSGVNDVTVGAAAARSFVAIEPGAVMTIRGSSWRVSGQFEGGGLWESELWTDIEPLQASFNAPSAVSVVWVKLDSPAAFSTFEAALNADHRLRDTRTELQRDYYARQIRFLTRFVRIAAIAIAAALAIAAVLAVANALTLALVSRRRELAVLRALGFGNAALTSALLIEVELVGLATVALTLGVGGFVLNGRQIATSAGHQAISFALALTPEVVAWAMTYSLLIGLLSAIVPARRAVRAPLVAALSGG